MALGPQGFSIIDLPPAAPEMLQSYEDLPLDPYMGNGTRFKRFAQYRLTPEPGRDTGWLYEKLPQRDYTTYKQFNKVGGGIRRTYETILADFTPMITLGADAMDLDRGEDWQINVHQNRTRADGQRPGPLTPEGVHHDGHEYVMIAVLRRNNVGGSETRLWKPGADEPFWTGTLTAGQAVLLDDKALQHDVTDVTSADGGPGHRDIVIVAFSRWKNKWYGDEHDEAALANRPKN
ncbi:2OG-Fe dioxygenase family protein [Streptomyces sp. NPDC059017]|uniref:2OG-Fe dioxygenase family protein n=1 Tax=unclassified Streptomyces TaxID=2593676 RepID=UPI0036BD705D